MRLRLALLAAVLALAACAAVDLKRPVTSEELGRIHKVAVISLMGDSFNGVSIGPTAINNRHFTAAVPDWTIDDFVESETVRLLRDTAPQRFAVAVLTHGNMSSAELRAGHAQRIWDLAKAQGFDTVVSVWPSLSENYPFYKPGYGFYEQALLGVEHRCLYAAYTVEAYDVTTERRIAWEWGGAEPCRKDSAQALTFRGGLEAYTDVEKLQMRLGLESRFSETLDYALKKMGLLARAAKAP